jgi:hypothetical protein
MKYGELGQKRISELRKREKETNTVEMENIDTVEVHDGSKESQKGGDREA